MMAGRMCFVAILVSLCAGSNSSKLVNTNVGTIEGTSETVDVKLNESEAVTTHSLYVFRGIPYGKINKRFTASQPADAFPSTFMAAEFGNICWNDLASYNKENQAPPVTTDPKAGNFNESEDCLNLNIYVPNHNGTLPTKLTVLFYIHGGFFSYGSGSSFDGRYLSTTQNVIVVTFNYRLGILGFLSTGTEASRGNYGLLDQRLALLWVRENIEAFGGDKDSITLFGHGAGATSAALHSLSPLSKGVFKRAILASGAAISPVPSLNVIDSDNGLLSFKELVRLLECQGDDIYELDLEAMVECLRSRPVRGSKLSLAIGITFSFILNNWVKFGPVVDGTFLPANPSMLLSNKPDSYTDLGTVSFPDTDVMFGINSNEGGRFILDMKSIVGFTFGAQAPDYGIYGGSRVTAFLNLAYPYTRYKDDVNTMLKSLSKKEYFNSTYTDIENRDSAFNLLSDRLVSGVIASARIHAQVATTSKTYMYVFDGKPNLLQEYSWNNKGANHGDDLPFILGTALVNNNTYPTSGIPIRQVDRDLSASMMKHLANFAKTGNPSENGDAIKWPDFTTQKQDYAKVSTRTNVTTISTTVETSYRQDKMKFWLEEVVAAAGDGPFVEASLYANRVILGLDIIYAFENVRGLTEDFHGKKVHVFRGVRYVKKNLKRFTEPTVATGIDYHDTDAYEFGPACPQFQPLGPSLADFTTDPKFHNKTSEDCLSLNIYVPYNTSKGRNKSVMVYIHDGEFLKTGSGASVDGRPLALQGDVIVVTFNYRLGIFGFLSTGDDAARGNWGLLDQRAALQWVKSFIGFFGGDSNSVTLFGSGIGGVCASLHALSPLSKGLFQRVISQSGAAIDSGAPWRISKRFLFVSNVFKTLNQCHYVNSTVVLACLRSVSADILVRQSYIILATGTFSYGTEMGPVIDDYFLLSQPGNNDVKFHQVDYMLGFNSNEGTAVFDRLPSQFAAQTFQPPYPIPVAYYDDVLELVVAAWQNREEVTEALKAKYPSGPTDGLVTRDNMMKMFGDSYFVSSVYNDALKHVSNMLTNSSNAASSTRKTFMYEFDHSPSLLVKNPWSDGYGAGHRDELPYVLGMPVYGKDALIRRGHAPSVVDEEMSRTMMAYWTNFAKTGDPSTGNLSVPKAWTPFTGEKRDVLVISSARDNTSTIHTEVKQNIRWEDAYYWNQYIPYIQKHYCAATTTIAATTTALTTPPPQTTTPELTTKSATTTESKVETTTENEIETTTSISTSTEEVTKPPTAGSTSTPIKPSSTPKPNPQTKPPVPGTTTSKPECPPIGERQLGNMAINVNTGETLIIALAAVACFLFITSIVLLILYCTTRNELKNVPKGHPIYDNPTFDQF